MRNTIKKKKFSSFGKIYVVLKDGNYFHSELPLLESVSFVPVNKFKKDRLKTPIAEHYLV
jgi:hypothetical protein